MQLPSDFIKRMEDMLGDEFDDFIRTYDEKRAYGLRFNPLKITREVFESEVDAVREPVPWAEEGYYYASDMQPGKAPLHEAGAYYIQEPSAMSAAELLEVKPGEKVCDLCAAPGGKSTQIAGKMMGEGLLVSNEYYGSRAKILSQNIERMGVRNAVVLNETSGHMAELFDEFFDNNGFFGSHSPLFGKNSKNLMKTDIRETDDAKAYRFAVELPGFKKDEISLDIKDGYLTIAAQKGVDKDEQDKKGRVLRQERYAGACSRSFYVGNVKPEDVKAKYEDGVLSVIVPKEDVKKLASSTAIAIE